MTIIDNKQDKINKRYLPIVYCLRINIGVFNNYSNIGIAHKSNENESIYLNKYIFVKELFAAKLCVFMQATQKLNARFAYYRCLNVCVSAWLGLCSMFDMPRCMRQR